MSGSKPLVFDPSRGLPREVAAQEPLQIPGPLAAAAGVGFHGTPPPASKAPVGGDWGESLAAVVEALIAAGFAADLRPQDWAAALASIRQLSHLGPYQVGRVVVGSVNGWAVLDQPLGSPGELQALIAGAGAAQTLPGGTQAQGLGYATVVAESAQEPLTVQRGSLWADSANKRFWIRTASGWVEITQYLPDATTSSKGLVQLADSAAIHAGTAGRVVDAAQLKAFTPPDATDAAKGIVQLADAAAITAGTAGRVVDAAQLKAAAAPDATDAVKGLVQLADAAAITAGTAGRVVDAAQLKAGLSDRAPAAGALVGSLTTPERTITAGAFDLATGPYWTCGAIAIPNPTNAVSGMSGLIRLTAAPTSWAANFKFEGGVAPAVSTVPAIVPFYVESASVIRMGQPVVVG